MYTSNIENRQHWSMLEHWRIGIRKSLISNLKHIVSRVQWHQVRSTPAAADDHPCRWPPWQLAMSVVVRRAESGRIPWWPGVWRDCCDTELKLDGCSAFTINISIIQQGVVCGARQAAVCRRLAVYSGSFRQQMTVFETIITNLHCLSNGGRRVDVCVFV